MTVMAIIHVAGGPGLASPELMNKLFSVWPQAYPARSSFSMKAPEDGAAVQEVERILNHHGFRRWTERHRRRDESCEYSFNRIRVYDDLDFAHAPLLRIFPEENVQNLEYRQSDGVLWLKAEHLKRQRHTFLVADGLTRAVPICSDTVKNQLESEKLSHLRFLPTVIVDDEDSMIAARPNHDHHPWWEISSDLVLPPVSTFLLKKDVKTMQDVPREQASRVQLIEPGAPGLELHYFHSELTAIDSFDIALSYEWKYGGETDRYRIVSNRFYEICKKYKIKTSWIPVRIDQGVVLP